MIRTRKKKHAPAPMYDPTRQSEFVELSASDIIVECGPESEDLKVIFEKNRPGGPKKIVEDSPPDGGSTLREDTVEVGHEEGSDDEGIGGEGNGYGGHELESEHDKVAELDRDGWEVIQAESAPTEDTTTTLYSEETSPSLQQRYICTNPVHSEREFTGSG